MARTHLLTATAAVAAVLMLAGCSSPQDEQAQPAPVATTETPGSSSPSPTAAATTPAPVSDIQSSVDTFVDALDELGIEHSEPVRAEVGASGAKARFDMTVNGYDAGINVFPDAETLAAWGELSDAYGGIFVSSGNAVLSLNSSDGIANSAEIAPALAEAVSGEARGV
jgi:outer membrane murein-binding lipoprotein Lpp